MPLYRFAGQVFPFPCPIPEVQAFAMRDGAEGDAQDIRSFSFPVTEHPQLIAQTQGWAAGAERAVKVFGAKSGLLLEIAGCGEYIIAPHGEWLGKSGSQPEALNQFDREIFLGPIVVLALAMRNVWSLHASAVLYKGSAIAFLGESGMGKSTLSAYLSKQDGWQLVADDILPLAAENGLQALPHFPQLKLPPEQQPGAQLPEHLPLKTVCVLASAEPDATPGLHQMGTAHAVQAVLGHTAGTRIFGAELLAAHLQFATQAATQVTAYTLTYPHRREALPLIQELLEKNHAHP